MRTLYFFAFYVLFKLIRLETLTNVTNECSLWAENHLFNNTELHIKLNNLIVIFENFEEFNIDCQKVRYNSSVLKFHAKRKINFENGIHLKKMISFLVISSRTQIVIQNMKGFNVNSNSTVLRQSDFANFYVYLNDVNFEFYLNNSLVGQNVCNSEYFQRKVFSYFGEVKYLFFNDDIFYSLVCLV